MTIISKNKNDYSFKSWITILIIACILLVGTTSLFFKNLNEFDEQMTVEYMEDTSGNMSLKDVLCANNEQFIKQDHSELSFGRSKSHWWIRFKLEDNPTYLGEKYLLLYNPTVAEVKLYLPIKNESPSKHNLYYSGWRFAKQKHDINFFYPTFLIDENVAENEYVYMNIYSTFTQNYDIKLLTEKYFEDYKDKRVLFIGMIFGIFSALILFNIVVFLELRDKTYFWYVMYLITLVIYEGDLLGVFSVYMPSIYAVLMKNTITLSLLVMLTSLTFSKVFFDIKGVFPKHNKYFTWIYIAVGIGLILEKMKFLTISNLYAHGLSLLGACYVIYIGVRTVSIEYRQAKFFLVGWAVVIFSLVISLMRHLGFIENNSFTINITIVAFALHAIFLSAAIVERMKFLIEEKKRDEVRIKSAEETANLNEILFLQAQIKPHFLYNTLNVIASLCRIDAEHARTLILDLSRYLHHTFSYKPDSYQCSLESELEYVKAYVNIEQARFKDKIKVVYEIAEVKDAIVPAMSIQPLVENAIRHGLRKGKGYGTIILRILELENRLQIEVEDDGIGLTKDQVDKINIGEESLSDGIGLININRRLEMLYGSELKVESILGKGSCFSFNIPKI